MHTCIKFYFCFVLASDTMLSLLEHVFQGHCAPEHIRQESTSGVLVFVTGGMFRSACVLLCAYLREL